MPAVQGVSTMIVIRDLNNDTRSVTTKLIAGQPGCQLMKKSTTENHSDTELYWIKRLQRHRFFRHAHYTHTTAKGLSPLLRRHLM
jgi:hypothetical protein